eukprot:12292041-Prorocentrum_lima.AAC.1
MDGLSRGSPKALVRLWLVIFDLPEWKAAKMGLETRFFELLGHFRMEPMNVAEFFLEESALAA